MDIHRIRTEVAQASSSFGWLEVRPTSDGLGVFVKAAFQTSAENLYTVVVSFPNYPNQMPTVTVTQPSIRLGCPHRYREGNICYLHPSYWNPGLHNLTLVLARTAKWLNKYEVWCVKHYWPGAEILH
jgi:hypothetical protein